MAGTETQRHREFERERERERETDRRKPGRKMKINKTERKEKEAHKFQTITSASEGKTPRLMENRNKQRKPKQAEAIKQTNNEGDKNRVYFHAEEHTNYFF